MRCSNLFSFFYPPVASVELRAEDCMNLLVGWFQSPGPGGPLYKSPIILGLFFIKYACNLFVYKRTSKATDGFIDCDL